VARRLGGNRPCNTVDLGNLTGIEQCVRYPRKCRPNVKCQHQGSLVTCICRPDHVGEMGEVVVLEERRKNPPFRLLSQVRLFTLAKLRLRWSDQRIWHTPEGHREPKRLGRYTCRGRSSNTGKITTRMDPVQGRGTTIRVTMISNRSTRRRGHVPSIREAWEVESVRLLTASVAASGKHSSRRRRRAQR